MNSFSRPVFMFFILFAPKLFCCVADVPVSSIESLAIYDTPVGAAFLNWLDDFNSCAYTREKLRKKYCKSDVGLSTDLIQSPFFWHKFKRCILKKIDNELSNGERLRGIVQEKDSASFMEFDMKLNGNKQPSIFYDDSTAATRLYSQLVSS